MSFVQFKLDRPFNSSRGIFDNYVYAPDNGDTIANISSAGYFQQSRFIGDPDWDGSFVQVVASDGTAVLQITGNTASPAGASIPEVVVIRSESDLPAPIAGSIALEEKEYQIVGVVNISNILVPPKNGFVTFVAINTLKGRLNYTGTDTLFKNTDFGIGVLACRHMSIGCSGGKIFDLDGTVGGAFLGIQLDFSVINDMGIIKGITSSIIIANVLDWGQGIIFDTNVGVVFSELTYGLGRNEVGATMVTILGVQENIEITELFLTTAGANETVLDIDPESTTLGGVASGMSFNIAAGGSIFSPDSKNQSDPEWRFSANTGVPDSTTKGVLHFEANALETVIAAEDVPVRINAIWSDGQVEERIRFCDKAAFDNTTNTLTSVDGFVDATGGTAFNHSLSNGDIVRLAENGGLPTGLSEIAYFVGDVTATTYRLYSDAGLTTLVTFSTDGTEPNYYDHTTGDSASGWFIYFGLDDITLNLSGWVTIQKSSGGDNTVRAVIMKSDASFNITELRDASLISAKNAVPSSSQVKDVANFSTGEGFLIYMENAVGGGTINNDVLDAVVVVTKA